MYSTQNMMTHNRISNYVINGIMNAKPEELILKIYDFAILKCEKDDLIKTNEALQSLIHALNFDSPETNSISTGLLRLYQFCQDQMRKKNKEIVLKILRELRDTWRSNFKL